MLKRLNRINIKYAVAFIGVVLGLAFGAFLENNFLAYPRGNLVGMALGIGVGIAIGLLMNRQARKHEAESRE